MKPTPHLLRLTLTTVLGWFAWLAVPAVHAGPFSPDQGDYGGLITVGESTENSGALTIDLSGSGQLTGTLNWQSGKYRVKGSLDANGNFVDAKGNPGKIFTKVEDPAATVTLTFQLLAGQRKITGALADSTVPDFDPDPMVTDPVAEFALSGAKPDEALGGKLAENLRVAFIDPPVTSMFADTNGATTAPQIPGDGFTIITIGKTKLRNGRFVGRLPDFQGAFSNGSAMRGPVYQTFNNLYKKKARRLSVPGLRGATPSGPAFGGQVFGEFDVKTVADSADPSLTALLAWGKRADPEEALYPDGFSIAGTNRLFLDGLKYQRPGNGQNPPIDPFLRPQIPATLRLRDGNLDAANNPLVIPIKISPFAIRVVGVNPHQVKMKMNPRRATFRGTFIHPVTKAETPFEGSFQAAVSTGFGQGRGSFAPMVPDDDTPRPVLVSGSVRIEVNL